ncbi:hypothetical protein M3649_19245 [Ureibacillus chungkukjangi]|uniref:competence protein CoiA family protein n=1 Tax=Ureibacillus chungkukjangi TaxID=1202712 RepID=UPI0020408A05|nr:competence protein CoiA family protein [Ureibacillus chungkukjangi]MCM3390237.1 hypothetical protein [Ureibacillus chungkukjangi]
MRFKLPYGLKNGKLVHISEVEKGLKCECVCPGCNSVLIARKGAKTTHHFAHYNGAECSKAVETALHLSAKEILQKHKKIRIPKVIVDLNFRTENWILSEEMYIEFDEIKLEYRLDNIVPDVIVLVKGKPLLIEITVTHKTDSEKLAKIKNAGISCIEINLSKINSELSVEDLEEIVIHQIELKNWLHNERVTFYKNKANSIVDRKKIKQRGLAIHVSNCPINSRSYNGWPYANVMDDCSCCEYCLDLKFRDNSIYCSGRKGIKSIADLRNA